MSEGINRQRLDDLAARISGETLDRSERQRMMRSAAKILARQDLDAGVRVHGLSFASWAARRRYVRVLQKSYLDALNLRFHEETQSEAQSAAPPAVADAPLPTIPPWGERIMRWTSQSDDVEAMLGDQSEKFARRVERDGLPSAKAWYRRELAKSVAAFAWRWTRSLLAIESLFNKLG